jgi:hypothetical protein
LKPKKNELARTHSQRPPSDQKGILCSWNNVEEEKYFKAVRKYGKNWDKVFAKIETKSMRQVLCHGAYLIKANKRKPGSVNSELIHILEGTPYKAVSQQVVKHWSKIEHNRFMKALYKHGAHWKLIQAYVQTKSMN